MQLNALFLTLLVAPALALGQAAAPAAPPPQGGELALAPSRLELQIKPGSSQTVVINVITTPSAGAKPMRLLASLGDWTMSLDGKMQFPRPGVVKKSAVPWVIYSPVEFVVTPGETQPIRVTIDVPADAPPGDHTAALFVEERPADIRAQKNKKEINFHFRLAAILYVTVPPFTQKGSLTALDARMTPQGLVIQPTLRNDGNSRVRPIQSFQLVDAAGNVVADHEGGEGYPVLAGGEYSPSFVVEKELPPGEYSVRYRVDFRDGGKVIEGRKAVAIPKKR